LKQGNHQKIQISWDLKISLEYLRSDIYIGDYEHAAGKPGIVEILGSL